MLGLFIHRWEKNRSCRINFFRAAKIFDVRERKFADFDAAMIFADRARDIGRRATGHETIRGESFLGFGWMFAGWMSLSHKSRAVSSGAAVRSSRRSSCRALITLTRASSAAILLRPSSRRRNVTFRPSLETERLFSRLRDGTDRAARLYASLQILIIFCKWRYTVRVRWRVEVWFLFPSVSFPTHAFPLPPPSCLFALPRQPQPTSSSSLRR